jgi:glutaredoxin
MQNPITLEILSKKDCPLCDEAKEVIENVLTDYPQISLTITDIESDMELFETYKEKIPVIRINNRDCFIYKVYPVTLRKNLDLLLNRDE